NRKNIYTLNPPFVNCQLTLDLESSLAYSTVFSSQSRSKLAFYVFCARRENGWFAPIGQHGRSAVLPCLRCFRGDRTENRGRVRSAHPTAVNSQLSILL
ncbi:MAG: hypothetical protein HC786_28760, partial [Richelia sp. CSU_2_1]|nr:hypothetical protein [Richelia sp. CSU_2_1]